jgi:hypothetical protein
MEECLSNPWSIILVENLIGPSLAMKFSVVYGILRFITVFTGAHHWSLQTERLKLNKRLREGGGGGAIFCVGLNHCTHSQP